MRVDGSKNDLNLVDKVDFLENKIKNLTDTIEFILNEEYVKAEKSLEKYKDTVLYILMSKLVASVSEQKNFLKQRDSVAYQFVKMILDGMPFPVFMKDEQFRYLLVNQLEAELFGLNAEEVIGKRDNDFVKDKEVMKVINESDTEVIKQNKRVELPNQVFKLKNGKSYIFKTHKIPFTNPFTGKCNILGFSIDVTDSVNLDKLKSIVTMVSNPYA
ncbi:MAG: PAS domain-containing protein [Cytophagaceae bacterium]|nr:PAS domain-containing protein [Cytophagaceae bacterium]MDW8456946.1 PAS domain-containing protein [Cytophagaceae bacterium]